MQPSLRVPSGTAEACENDGELKGHAGLCRPCRGCGRERFVCPTAEAVGYSRVSLAGHRVATVPTRWKEA